jgi:hypothetical protein
MTNRYNSELSPARSSAAPLLSALSLCSSAHSAPLRYHFLFHCLPVLCGESSFFSGLSSLNCQISAIIAKSGNITLRLSIILSNNVGAPTFLIFAPPLSCSARFLNLKLTTDNLKLHQPRQHGLTEVRRLQECGHDMSCPYGEQDWRRGRRERDSGGANRWRLGRAGRDEERARG